MSWEEWIVGLNSNGHAMDGNSLLRIASEITTKNLIIITFHNKPGAIQNLIVGPSMNGRMSEFVIEQLPKLHHHVRVFDVRNVTVLTHHIGDLKMLALLKSVLYLGKR